MLKGVEAFVDELSTDDLVAIGKKAINKVKVKVPTPTLAYYINHFESEPSVQRVLIEVKRRMEAR